tara:strand:+ start:362 stop:577 length:216 start_codon:yes stop_codon:yes gene_type:complete
MKPKNMKQFIEDTWIRVDFAEILKDSSQKTLYKMVEAIMPKLSESNFENVIHLMVKESKSRDEDMDKGVAQ